MANKNKLSIYLLKEKISNIEDIFENSDEIQIFQKYDEDFVAYYAPSYVHEPSWVKSFFLQGSNGLLQQANSRVVILKKLLVENEERLFALTFGYARFLFKENVLEEQFGLRIVLNSIKQDQIRRISKTSIGTNQKQSNEQLPKNSDISEFGFDINRDLMKNVSGKSEDEIFEKSMLTGNDIFSLTVSRDIKNIDEFLVYCYKKYKETTYQEKFAWIDNIKYIKDKQIIEKLNEQVILEIKNKNYSQVWMAVPEVVNWENICDFMISGLEEHFEDIYIDKVIETLKNELTDINQLKNKKIKAVSRIDSSQSIYEWSAYNCLIAEITLEEQEYCLNNGKWYKINNDFTTRINDDYSHLSLCEEAFIDYNHNNEDDYNEALSENLKESILLHTYKISVGGGQGNNIEPCDVLWKNKLIHIKRNGGSSVLSHLFNQALVSCQMWLDTKSRNQLKEKLREKKSIENVISEPFIPSNYEVIIAIINKFNDARPKIPFFSKVAICFTASNIENLGYKLSIKNIKMKEK